jgi:hypothetical protein
MGRTETARPKQAPKHHRRKSPKRGAKPPATANKQLGRQIRKILGKHYASKYRVR